MNSIINEIKYTFDKDNRIKNVKLDDSTYITTSYDGLSRVNNKELKVGTDTYTTEYTYEDVDENKTTTSLESIKNGTNDEISYTYDVLGNIETISEGSTLKAKYYYDELSQLIREDNVELNKTIIYSYDLGGNITDKKEYEYTIDDLTNLTTTNTISYSYTNTNWKDQLTNYNGNAITYDAIGNPLTYNGNTYTWQNGRQLASITNGANTYSYKYNDSGIRTSKTVNGVETKFYLER